MTDTSDIPALVERLRKRAAVDRQCATNNEHVAMRMTAELDAFERNDGSHNVYATRLAVDHRNNAKLDAAYADDLDEAADALTRLQAENERRAGAASDGEAMRQAVTRFLADYDDGDRAEAGTNPLMEAHVADFRAALASPPQPSTSSADVAGLVPAELRALRDAERRTLASSSDTDLDELCEKLGEAACIYDSEDGQEFCGECHGCQRIEAARAIARLRRGPAPASFSAARAALTENRHDD